VGTNWFPVTGATVAFSSAAATSVTRAVRPWERWYGGPGDFSMRRFSTASWLLSRANLDFLSAFSQEYQPRTGGDQAKGILQARVPIVSRANKSAP
jgi:hypothetical protein